MARIIRQATVVRDGMHNAFTDLAWWQGAYWVSYRKGSGHVGADGTACLSVSTDRHRFRQAASLRVNGDARDPKLIPMHDGRLALSFAAWEDSFPSPGVFTHHRLQHYLTFSDNGFNWEKPRPVYEPDNWIWRIRPHNDGYQSLAYGLAKGPAESSHWSTRPRRQHLSLLASHDLIHWDLISLIGSPEMALGESDLHIRDDGEMWVISRSSHSQPRQPSYFSSAKPPYTDWEVVQLDAMIHAPVMLEHQGELYVAGRRSADLEQDHTFPFLGRSSLGLWRVLRCRVQPLLRIPATGDCSYPGIIRDPDGRICMSYYSQHAYHMGVLDQRFSRQSVPPHRLGEPLAQNDVYFAEIQLP